MPLIRLVRAPGHLTRAQIALGMSQEELGRFLGVSRRTMVRWAAGGNGPTFEQWVVLVRRVHGVDPALAAQIAQQMGETLESLGLARRSPSPPTVADAAQPSARPAPPITDLVDSIVCAAAEAGATTPQAVRPMLLAAFERTASVALSIDEVRAALRGGAEKKPSRKPARPDD